MGEAGQTSGCTSAVGFVKAYDSKASVVQTLRQATSCFFVYMKVLGLLSWFASLVAMRRYDLPPSSPSTYLSSVQSGYWQGAVSSAVWGMEPVWWV